jgi:tetratricopeptide (TPR) repeat protein
MHEYLVTGRTADGDTATEIVEAATGDEAVRAFEDQGHTDIVLHTGETQALWYKPSTLVKLLHPREIVALREIGAGRQCALLVRMLYRKLWPVVLLCGIPMAIAVAFDLEFDWIVWGTLALALSPILIGLWLCFLGSGARYRRLLVAVGWGDWPEVLRLVPRVKLQLPAMELPLRKAQALAGLGRVPEALLEYDRLDDDPSVSRPIFWGYRALVYIAAHDRANAIVVLERAQELMPDNPDVLVDLAALVMVVRRDVPRARRLLAEAGRHVLADTTYPFYRACEGLIALAEKRPAEAVKCLEEAVRLVEPFLRGNPSVRYHIARLGGHLALAYAASGDHEAARREADRARPVLRANRDATMLAWLADAVGE